MSSNVTNPSQKQGSGDVASSPSGLKAKAKATANANAEEQDDDDDDEEEEEEDEEMASEDEEGEEEKFEAIDPTAIIGSRRTRGIRVDYTSKEALAKAGLEKDADDDEDTEDDMKE